MLGVALVIIVIAIIAYKFYKLSLSNVQYFEKRNLKYLGVAAALKTSFKLSLRIVDIVEFNRIIYDQFPNEK